MEQWQIGRSSFVVGAVTENLQHDVCRTKDLGAIGNDRAAFVDVFRVGISSFQTSASLNHDFQARFRKTGDYRGHKRYAPLARKNLSGNTHNHEASLFRIICVGTKGGQRAVIENSRNPAFYPYTRESPSPEIHPCLYGRHLHRSRLTNAPFGSDPGWVSLSNHIDTETPLGPLRWRGDESAFAHP